MATLGQGSLVGEIALLRDGEKRMATVRTAEPSVLLILDKKSFRELDSETLALISENAKYNKACTREPSARTAGAQMARPARRVGGSCDAPGATYACTPMLRQIKSAATHAPKTIQQPRVCKILEGGATAPRTRGGVHFL